MPIPTHPAANRIRIQPNFAFGRFKTVFNDTSRTSHLREYSERGVGRGKGVVGNDLIFILLLV